LAQVFARALGRLRAAASARAAFPSRVTGLWEHSSAASTPTSAPKSRSADCTRARGRQPFHYRLVRRGTERALHGLRRWAEGGLGGRRMRPSTATSATSAVRWRTRTKPTTGTGGCTRCWPRSRCRSAVRWRYTGYTAAELVADGICPATIGVKRKGETDPLVPTGDGVREPQKRRMEIVFPQGTSPSTTNCRSRRASRRGFSLRIRPWGLAHRSPAVTLRASPRRRT
jgi:hypothetical protein